MIDMTYMEQALSLARLALGQVSPNPAVGAVIVNGGEVVGEGHTQPPGSSHAEIMALRQAGERARGGVMYVTLEPCCHHGRTPPCVDAILDAGIAEVHMAMLDPNPQVAGKGWERLEVGGVVTHLGEGAEEAAIIVEAYVKFITTAVPFVTAKFAMSLDGKIATRRGDSKWISGEAAREVVHNLRYINDAVMVGINTVLKDDPELTARTGDCKEGTVRAQPLRVVVDSDGRTPPSARLLAAAGKTLLALARPLRAGEKESFAVADAELIEVASRGGAVNLKELLVLLGKRGVASVLVEGGGTLLGSLFDDGLVDKVVAFVAPVVIGGEEAKTAVGGRGVESLSQALRLKRVSVERLGDDVMINGYVEARR